LREARDPDGTPIGDDFGRLPGFRGFLAWSNLLAAKRAGQRLHTPRETLCELWQVLPLGLEQFIGQLFCRRSLGDRPVRQ